MPVMLAADTEDAKLTIGYLTQAADWYVQHIPKTAAHLMSVAERLKNSTGFASTSGHQACSYCGSIFKGDNHHVRLKRKTKASKKIRKLLQKGNSKKSKTNSLSSGEKIEERILKRFKQNSVMMVTTCKLCGKSDKRPVPKRKKPVFDSVPCQPPEKLTKSMKRKLKKKQARNKQALLVGVNDSGLDLSFSPGVSSTPVRTNAPNLSFSSQNTSGTSGLGKLSSSYSNTSTSSTSISSSFNQSASKIDTNVPNTGSMPNTSSSKPSNQKARNKLKNSTLQGILQRQQKRKDQEGNSGLRSFLSSL